MIPAQRNAHDERRAPALAFASNFDRSVMQVDQLPYDGKPEPKASVVFADAQFLLAEPLEYAGHEFLGNPLPMIEDDQLKAVRQPRGAHLDRTALRRKFDRVTQQIPYDLLQAGRVSLNGTAFAFEDRLNVDFPGQCGFSYHIQRRAHHGVRIDR